MGESNIGRNELSKTTRQKKQAQAEAGEVKQPDTASKSEAGEQGSEEEGIDVLQAAQDEIAELEDKLLRAYAEMDNLRKRGQRELTDAHKFGVEKFVMALLDVVDNLERALDVEQDNEAGLREGVRLTLDSWHNMMKKFEVERIDAVGETFDPHRHEALSQMPSDEPEGTVISQHVAGYTLHGRLIRPAKVLVSSGAAETGEQEQAGDGRG